MDIAKLLIVGESECGIFFGSKVLDAFVFFYLFFFFTFFPVLVVIVISISFIARPIVARWPSPSFLGSGFRRISAGFLFFSPPPAGEEPLAPPPPSGWSGSSFGLPEDIVLELTTSSFNVSYMSAGLLNPLTHSSFFR